MGGYIGATAVGLTTTAADVQGDITSTDTTPELILKNTSEEDTEGGREGKITFKGEQSGGEESTLAQIESAHDGTADDQKGDLIFKTNDGSDSASPTEAMRIDSAQNVGIGATSINRKLEVSGNNNGGAKANYIRITDTDTTATASNQIGGIEFFSSDSSGGAGISASIETIYAGSGGGGEITFNTNATSGGTLTERMRIDESGNVGIGDTSPDNFLNVKESALSSRGASNGNTSMTLEHATDTGIQFFSANQVQIRFGDAASTGAGSIIYNHSDNSLRTSTNGSERMRIDSSGRLLVGKTTNSRTTAGCELNQSGFTRFTAASDKSLELVRTGTTGEILEFFDDSTHTGTIGTASSRIYIGTGSVGLGFSSSSLGVFPINATGGALRDNAIDLGLTSARFDDVRATNGTIQTSDEREKQQIASLTDAEITAAKAISKLFKTFKWNDKVEAKGDAARTHTGVIAQQVETAMSDAGLDAGKYAFFISDTWWETQTEVAAVEADEENGIEAQEAYTRTDIYDTQEEAPEGATERNRKGIRYPELLSFIGAATEQRLTSIEARLDALEGA